jgi:thiol-disulfide isomerase/thioredoxin
MKKLFLLLALLPASLWAFQKTAAPGKTVTLVCFLNSVPQGVDSIGLYELGGLGNRLLLRGGRRMPDSAFVLKVPASKARFYGVGLSNQSVAKVILGEEPEVKLYANAEYMDKARSFGSPANAAYEKLFKQLAALMQESEALPTQNDFNTKYQALSTRKTRLLDSLKAADPLLWRTAGLYLYPDFSPSNTNYRNRADFMGKEYFKNTNLSDEAYAGIPAVFEAFDNYAQTITRLRLPADQADQAISAQLAKMNASALSHRMALGGIVSGMKSSGNPLYLNYAKKYIDLYRKNSFGEVAPMDMELKRSGTSTPGFEAPDLMGMTPDSSTFALSKLRGKVVLVDFWASWCGPCRRENPNVVANYKKYKDKGFEILGVSLDRDINAWRKAIKDDGLPWFHISDLKGWQSAHAALYSVSSIPQTVLVDKEGKIIVRNIRGEQLGAKLEELFGK